MERVKTIEEVLNTNYDILGYFKKRTFVKGELVNVKYYANYDEATGEYSGLRVEEIRVYVRNELGLAVKREMLIKFYNDLGEVICEKNTVKYYSIKEAFEEDRQRSLNIVEEAKIYVLSVLGVVNGKDLLNSLVTEVNLFIEGDGNPLRQKIGVLDKPYLTSEIRSTLINIFTL